MGDLDLTIAGFRTLADESEGRVSMDWRWA
jgi:hypothetical protein